MTGTKLLSEVVAALRNHATGSRHRPSGGDCKACRNLLPVLDGCVLLTADEAEKVRKFVPRKWVRDTEDGWVLVERPEHALLTPDGKDDQDWRYSESPSHGVCEACGRAK